MACFQGYVSFREGISPVLLDFDDWYGCYSRDIDNKLEVLFLFFSFLFSSSKVKFGFLAWFEAWGSAGMFWFSTLFGRFSSASNGVFGLHSQLWEWNVYLKHLPFW